MEKENQGILEMIPPLRGGDFQGIAGLSSDDSLLVGVNSARAKFYEGPRAVKHRLDEPGQIIPQHGCVPALPASVSPGKGNFSGKATKAVQGQLRTKRLPSLTQGWKSSYHAPLPVEGEIFFLTFPFIDQALTLKMPVTELRAAQSWGCSLPGLTTSQTPQSAHRKDEREHGGDAECVKRPDEQEWSAALREFPVRCHHVDDRHCQPKQ